MYALKNEPVHGGEGFQPAVEERNFAKIAVDAGGKVVPMLIPSQYTAGSGLMNPSIINDNGKLRGIIRHVNYTFYHSERKLFQVQWGPLTYIHPENDLKLRTWNWYVEFDDDLNVSRYNMIDTSQFDTYEPQWDFVGLEDARIIRWEDELWITGVRRDTTTNGQGRMELSKIDVQDDKVVETARHRIEPPNDPNSYCEKNWMPVLHEPWTYVKWSNPTEIVSVNKEQGTSQTTHIKEFVQIRQDLRGGSQAIPYGDGYIALTHEVDLFQSEHGRKDAVYKHRFVVWDKDWNIVKYSRSFLILDGQVEFSVGMCYHEDNVLITFGFTDNAAYILSVPKQTLIDFIDGKV